MSNLKEFAKADLEKWYEDYNEVQQYVNARLEKCKDREIEEQQDFILNSFNRVVGYNVCSDTYQPMEYIDFNFGSITCTISWYDRQVGELLDCFDGYTYTDGIEDEGCACEVSFKEVKEILGKENN